MDDHSDLPHEEYTTIYHYDTMIFSFVALAAFATFLRLYCRYFLNKAFGLDDVLAFLALLFTAWQAAHRHWQIVEQRKKYYWLLSAYAPDDHPYDDKANWPQEWLDADQWSVRHGNLHVMTHGAALGFIKASVLCFYLRFIINKRPRMLIHTIMGFNIVATVWWILINGLGARPIQALWYSASYPNSTYILEVSTQQVIFSACHVFLDIALLAFPIPAIIELRLPRFKKVGLVLIYSTSFASFGATIMNLYENIEYDKDFQMWPEKLRQHTVITFWTNTEICTAVLCASMPAMSNLFRFCVNKCESLIPDIFKRFEHRINSAGGRTPGFYNVFSFGVRSSHRAPAGSLPLSGEPSFPTCGLPAKLADAKKQSGFSDSVADVGGLISPSEASGTSTLCNHKENLDGAHRSSISTLEMWRLPPER